LSFHTHPIDDVFNYGWLKMRLITV
jgi:hypothetical protein